MNDYPKMTRGLSSALDSTPIEDGTFRYCIDTGKVFLDSGSGESGKRIPLNDIVTTYNDYEIKKMSTPSTKLYLASDTKKLYIYLNTIGWYNLTGSKLSTDDEDKQNGVWFSDPTKTEDNTSTPSYDKDFNYNPGTKTLNVINLNSKSANIGNLNITTSTVDDKRIVDFSFI